MSPYELIESVVVIGIGVACVVMVLRQHAPRLAAKLGLVYQRKLPRAVPPSCHTGATKAESHCVGGCGGCGGGSGAPSAVRAHD